MSRPVTSIASLHARRPIRELGGFRLCRDTKSSSNKCLLNSTKIHFYALAIATTPLTNHLQTLDQPYHSLLGAIAVDRTRYSGFIKPRRIDLDRSDSKLLACNAALHFSAKHFWVGCWILSSRGPRAQPLSWSVPQISSSRPLNVRNREFF